MIPVDCYPMHFGETVLEIVDGPNKFGQYTFFLYWLGQGHFTGTRGQIFLADPKIHKHDRVVDARRGPRQYFNSAVGEEPAMRCPECGSSNCVAEPFDFGVCSQTGYHDAGVWGKCLACGIQSDVVDFKP